MQAIFDPGVATPEQIRALDGLPSFRRLVAVRRRLGLLTAGVVAAIYVGFFALTAFGGRWMGEPASGLTSRGLLLMVGMYVWAWAMTWAYLRYTRVRIAPLEAAVRADLVGTAGSAR
jgi:uncharacterized membrane protein (DUF485 family)